MFGPKWSQHIDKTRMLHDSIFISWISSSVAPTRTAPPEHSLFQGSFYFLHGETDVSLGCDKVASTQKFPALKDVLSGPQSDVADLRVMLRAPLSDTVDLRAQKGNRK